MEANLKKLQIICIEVCNQCNMSFQHQFCPASKDNRYKNQDNIPDDFQLIEFLNECKKDGFEGYLGFHYYSEPTLNLKRCRKLAKESNLKTLIWTNGYKEATGFDKVFKTKYDGKGNMEFKPDDRLAIYDTEPISGKDYRPCFRPYHTELAIDYYGELHICCGDYKAEIEVGNLCNMTPRELLNRFYLEREKAITGCEVCSRCQNLKNSPAITDYDFFLTI